MAENSKIQWCHHTLNPWRGCSKISDGCTNCYAATMSNRNPGTLGVWGDKGTRVVASESMWREPLKWDRKAKAAGERNRVFCASLADVFEDWKGPMTASNGSLCYWCNRCQDKTAGATPEKCLCGSPMRPLTTSDVRARLFRLIDATPNLDWLLLTKRPENMATMIPDRDVSIADCDSDQEAAARLKYRPNLWLGVSVENQEATWRIGQLLKIPAAVRFVSAEPLLGLVNFAVEGEREGMFSYLTGRLSKWPGVKVHTRGIDWVIVGGESGHGARPCNVAWVRSIVEQCRAADVPCFVKQLGQNVECRNDDVADWFDRAGHLQLGPNERFQGATGRVFGFNDKKGGWIGEWPEDLRVRQFPTPIGA